MGGSRLAWWCPTARKKLWQSGRCKCVIQLPVTQKESSDSYWVAPDWASLFELTDPSRIPCFAIASNHITGHLRGRLSDKTIFNIRFVPPSYSTLHSSKESSFKEGKGEELPFSPYQSAEICGTRLLVRSSTEKRSWTSESPPPPTPPRTGPCCCC